MVRVIVEMLWCSYIDDKTIKEQELMKKVNKIISELLLRLVVTCALEEGPLFRTCAHVHMCRKGGAVGSSGAADTTQPPSHRCRWNY